MNEPHLSRRPRPSRLRTVLWCLFTALQVLLYLAAFALCFWTVGILAHAVFPRAVFPMEPLPLNPWAMVGLGIIGTAGCVALAIVCHCIAEWCELE